MKILLVSGSWGLMKCRLLLCTGFPLCARPRFQLSGRSSEPAGNPFVLPGTKKLSARARGTAPGCLQAGERRVRKKTRNGQLKGASTRKLSPVFRFKKSSKKLPVLPNRLCTEIAVQRGEKGGFSPEHYNLWDKTGVFDSQDSRGSIVQRVPNMSFCSRARLLSVFI